MIQTTNAVNVVQKDDFFIAYQDIKSTIEKKVFACCFHVGSSASSPEHLIGLESHLKSNKLSGDKVEREVDIPPENVVSICP